MDKKALVAMSGGVDSSVAAYLMKEMGYECAGATMKLHGGMACSGGSDSDNTALGDDIQDAQKVAQSLDMKFYICDFSDKFAEKVISNFVRAYENGMTPNPCIECNRHLKFQSLYEKATELGYDYIVTGHYSRIEYDENTGRYLLRKASDPAKDQSYVLYSLTQEQLAHTIFPLSSISKDRVRQIACENSFINADKRESQDICFVPDGSYTRFIKEYTKKDYPEGDFVDTDGNVLGRHKGIIYYTIGQRKGLGLSFPKPMYVVDVDPEKNQVVLGEHEELFSRELDAVNINLISVGSIDKPMRVKAKVRYRHVEQWATVTQTEADRLHVVFDEPQRAITKGQAVVLYDNDVVVGGGTIIS